MQFECAGSVAPAIHRHASLTPCLLESDGTEEFRIIGQERSDFESRANVAIDVM